MSRSSSSRPCRTRSPCVTPARRCGSSATGPSRRGRVTRSSSTCPIHSRTSPCTRARRSAARAPRGLYGDVVEELDWSVGQVLAAIRDQGLAESTLVVFTSDNGPWLIKNEQGGSAGLLREGKGSTWEGGVRVPCLAWWPGTIAPGRVVQDLATEMDWFATGLDLAGAKVPADRTIDGVSLVPVLRGTGPSPRDRVYYYFDTELMAVRRRTLEAPPQDDRPRRRTAETAGPRPAPALPPDDRPVRAPSTWPDSIPKWSDSYSRTSRPTAAT